MPLFWISGILCLTITMVIYPQEIFSASFYGLKIWWEIVFPSLLPFFIIADLFMSLGAIRILGTLVEPLMRPLFNLPGESALVVAIGYTSGFPIGAAFTAKLRKENVISRIEAERLLAFTNNASPLFMFVAVSVGMLGLPDTGIIIASSHYLANIFIGLIYRYYGYQQIPKRKQVGYLQEIKTSFKETINKKTKPIGFLLGDAVKNAMQSLTSIGGYIIFFAVLLKSLELLGVIGVLVNITSFVFPESFASQMHTAISKGFFEMTIGSKTAGEAISSLESKLIVISILLAWSGLSIHAQVLSQISGTDIRYIPFFIARILHAIIAAVLCKIIFESKIFNIAQKVSFGFSEQTNIVIYEWWTFVYVLVFLILISFAIVGSKNILKLIKTIY